MKPTLKTFGVTGLQSISIILLGLVAPLIESQDYTGATIAGAVGLGILFSKYYWSQPEVPKP